LDEEEDLTRCYYCNRNYKSEKVVQMHYKKIHEKKVQKLDKKLNKKAHKDYKPSKKSKMTLPLFKA
jgi:hypothetical protein